MNRLELDELTAHYGLTVEGVDAALQIVQGRPSRAEITAFTARMLRLAGVLSLAAGVVYWVAANWSALAVVGRFAVVVAPLLAAVAVSLWRPPPHPVGRYALLFAFLVSGALFALYGQTYQTGADVYELFLNWALLGILLVAAAQWSVAWAAWVLVLNVALALFCGARPETGIFWIVFAPWDLRQSDLLLLPLALDLLLWGATLALERTRWSSLAPAWLGRFALASAVAFGTWAGMIVIIRAEGPPGGYLGLLVPIVAFAAVAMHTLKRRVDVFPLATIEASMIVLSTTAIVRYGDWDDSAALFVIAAWLILSSSIAGRWLMRLVRAWQPAGSDA